MAVRKLAVVLFLFGSWLTSSIAAPNTTPEYRLGAGDRIRIAVYKHPDLDTLARISQDGRISFPLLGSLKVAGKSEREVEKMIAVQLHKGGYVNFPQVNVSVESYESRQVAVLGHVNQPGKYVIEAGATVVDAISLAGGVSPSGGDRAVVTRQLQRGDRRKTSRHEVDLVAILENGDSSANLTLQEGDVVYVPPMSRVYVYGAVRSPGAYRLEKQMTVVEVLSLAGGLYLNGTHKVGSEKRIEIRRRDESGAFSVFSADLEDQLRPGDVVQVNESLF